MRGYLAIAALLAGGLGLAGCATQQPDLSVLPEQQQPKSVQVVRSDRQYELRVVPRSGELAPSERERLRDAAAETGAPATAHVTLRGAQSRAVLERAAHFLVAAGVPRSHIVLEPGHAPTDATAPRDAIELVVSRYTVVVPACPDWSRTDALGNQNPVSSNLGCATAANFSQMLADPKDLVEGRGSATTAAGPAADAVAAYRAGRTQPLPSDVAPPNLMPSFGAKQ